MIVTMTSTTTTDRFGAFLALLLAVSVLFGKLFSEIPQKYVFLRMPFAASIKSRLRGACYSPASGKRSREAMCVLHLVRWPSCSKQIHPL